MRIGFGGERDGNINLPGPILGTRRISYRGINFVPRLYKHGGRADITQWSDLDTGEFA